MNQNHGEPSAKDLIIAQLRQELGELRERSAQVSELSEKLTNAEFSLQLVTNEKQAAERENTVKMEQNLKVISQLRSEVDLLSRKLVSEESKGKLNKGSLAEYELELHRAREDKLKAEKEAARLNDALREAQCEAKRCDDQTDHPDADAGGRKGRKIGGVGTVQGLQKRAD